MRRLRGDRDRSGWLERGEHGSSVAKVDVRVTGAVVRELVEACVWCACTRSM